MRGGRWTEDDDRLMQEMRDQPIASVAAALGRTESAIRSRRKVLGITRPPKPWTGAGICTLRATAHLPAHVIAKATGRTVYAIHKRRSRAGISRVWSEL